MQFLTEVDLQIVRMGSEIMLLQQIIEEQRAEIARFTEKLNEVNERKAKK